MWMVWIILRYASWLDSTLHIGYPMRTSAYGHSFIDIYVQDDISSHMFLYTTFRSLNLGLLSKGWEIAFLLFLLLLQLPSLLPLLLLVSLMLLLSPLDPEFSDFKRWGWSFFISDNWTGFSRNSSAPPSRHLFIKWKRNSNKATHQEKQIQQNTELWKR